MAPPKIQANYDALFEVIELFQTHNHALTNRLIPLRATLDSIESGKEWEGVAYDQFKSEMDGDVFPAILRLRDSFIDSASVILRIIDLMKAAEDASSKHLNMDK